MTEFDDCQKPFDPAASNPEVRSFKKMSEDRKRSAESDSSLESKPSSEAADFELTTPPPTGAVGSTDDGLSSLKKAMPGLLRKFGKVVIGLTIIGCLFLVFAAALLVFTFNQILSKIPGS